MRAAGLVVTPMEIGLTLKAMAETANAASIAYVSSAEKLVADEGDARLGRRGALAPRPA